MSRKILVVEDNKDLAQLLDLHLRDLSYDVDPAGENFLMRREQGGAALRLEVIVNWLEELKAKVGN